MKTMFCEAKMLFRQRLIYVLIPLTLFYFYMGLREAGIIGLPLTYVIQFLIFGFLVVGYWTGIREQNSGSSSVLNALPASYKHWFVQALLTAGYALLLVLALLFVFLGMAMNEQADISWMINGVRYMLLYFLLPSLISLMIGLVLAQIVHSKIAYVIILIMGFLLGPLGSEVYHIFMGFLFAEGGSTADFFYRVGSKVINLLRISQYSLRDLPNDLYGYVAESVLFYRSLCFLYAVTGIYFLLPMVKTLYSKSKRRLGMLSIISIALSILFGVLMQKPVFVYRQGSTDELGELVYESGWLSDNPVVEITDRDHDITISAIEGELDLRQSLHFTGTITLSNPNRTDHLALKLYRGFLVKELMVTNGSSSWEQEGDWIHVKLDNPNKKDTLEIEYAGFSSPYFFAGEQAVFLPGYFAFLPQLGSKPVFGMSVNKEVHMNAFEAQNTVFDLEVKSKVKLASNLTEAEGRWMGRLEKEGPVFIGGHLEKTDWKGILLYIAGMPAENQETQYLSELMEMTEKIRADLGNMPVEPVKRIFFVPFNTSILGNSHGILQGGTLYIHSILRRVDATPGVVLLGAVQLYLSSEPGIADAYRAMPSVEAGAITDKILTWAAIEYGIDANEVPIDEATRKKDPDILRNEIGEILRRLADDTN